MKKEEVKEEIKEEVKVQLITHEQYINLKLESILEKLEELINLAKEE